MAVADRRQAQTLRVKQSVVIVTDPNGMGHSAVDADGRQQRTDSGPGYCVDRGADLINDSANCEQVCTNDGPSDGNASASAAARKTVPVPQ